MSATTELNIRANLNPIHHTIQSAPNSGLHTAMKEFVEYVAAYNPPDLGSNFSGGVVPKNVLSMQTTVRDSLNVPHKLTISFGKIRTNQWAVETKLSEYVDEELGATMSNSVVPGRITSGWLTFDGSGKLCNIAPTLSAPMCIVWKDGADALPITINWGAVNGVGVGGNPAEAGITQTYIDDATSDLTIHPALPGETRWELVIVGADGADHA